MLKPFILGFCTLCVGATGFAQTVELNMVDIEFTTQSKVVVRQHPDTIFEPVKFPLEQIPDDLGEPIINDNGLSISSSLPNRAITQVNFQEIALEKRLFQPLALGDQCRIQQIGYELSIDVGSAATCKTSLRVETVEVSQECVVLSVYPSIKAGQKNFQSKFPERWEIRPEQLVLTEPARGWCCAQ